MKILSTPNIQSTGIRYKSPNIILDSLKVNARFIKVLAIRLFAIDS